MAWHPAPEQIERYQRRRGTIAETMLVAQHLDECATCSGSEPRTASPLLPSPAEGQQVLAHDFRALWWVFILVSSLSLALFILLTYE